MVIGGPVKGSLDPKGCDPQERATALEESTENTQGPEDSPDSSSCLPVSAYPTSHASYMLCAVRIIVWNAVPVWVAFLDSLPLPLHPS